MSSITRRKILPLAFAIGALASAAQASDYPTKPVTMVVAASAGSGPDALARIVADRLSRKWGQQITVMNKTGNYGAIALRSVTTAPADGHTLVVSVASSFTVWPELQKAAAIELQREIIPIALLGVQPMIVAINPSVGVNTLSELVAITQQRPDEILFGGSRGTIPHLTGVRLGAAGEVKWRFIPSPGPRAIQDAMSGNIHVAIESIAALRGPMSSGLLKGLAVASTNRLPDVPDLPTVGEVVPQLSGFDARGWVALRARTGTPEAVILKVNRDIRAIMSDPDVRQLLSTLGTYPESLSPEETAAFIQSEKDLWRPIVQSLDLTTQ